MQLDDRSHDVLQFTRKSKIEANGCCILSPPGATFRLWLRFLTSAMFDHARAASSDFQPARWPIAPPPRIWIRKQCGRLRPRYGPRFVNNALVDYKCIKIGHDRSPDFASACADLIYRSTIKRTLIGSILGTEAAYIIPNF